LAAIAAATARHPDANNRIQGISESAGGSIVKFASILFALAIALSPTLWAQETPDTPPQPETPEAPDDAKPDAKPEDKPEEAKPAAEAKPTGSFGMRFLDVASDGGTLAFTLYGDIWTVPTSGGRAARLTLNEANDMRPKFSPDGKRIAFSSDRSGNFDVWMMPSEGGEATRVSFDSATDSINSFDPDGRSIIYQSNASGELRLWRMPVAGGISVMLTPIQAKNGVMQGEWLYFDDGNSEALRKGYRGTRNDELWRMKRGSLPERLTTNNQNDREGRPSPDGKKLFFIRETGEKGQDYNLFSMDLDTKAETQLTNLDSLGMTFTTFNADCSKVWFVWKNFVWSLDLSVADAKPQQVVININEDSPRDKVVVRTMSSGADNLDLSLDGKTIAFDLGGSIWVMPAMGGEARRITAAGSGDTYPRISPDGRTIAFHSQQRSGNDDIWLIDISGANLRQLTKSDKGDFFHNWSPDGTYLIFCSDRSGNKDIWRQPIDGSAAVQLTNAEVAEDDPSVSPDGRMIAFDGHAAGNADIYVMNADGTGPRRVYGTPAQEESPRFSPDMRFLVFTRTRTGLGMQRDVVVTDMAGTGEVVIGAGSSGVFSRDGSEIYYLNARGEIRVAPAPTSLDGGRGVLFLAKSEINERAQFVAAFDEAWNLVKNNFYDTKYHGVDWDAAQKRYKPLIENARTRLEFHMIVSDMIGELNASHQGIYGSVSDLPNYNTGTFGVEELRPEPMEGGARRPAGPPQAGPGAPEGGGDRPRRPRRPGNEDSNSEEPADVAPWLADELFLDFQDAPAPQPGTAEGRRPGGRRPGGSGPQAQPIRLKVVGLDKDGPLDKAWVREGDYILAIDGTNLTTATNVSKLMENKAGQVVKVTVAASTDPKGERPRVVEVTAEPAAARRNREYGEWIRKNQTTARENSKNQVAYIHIPGMNQTELRRFENNLRAAQSAKALVLDVRNNGGGNIHQELIDLLARKKYANMFSRTGRDQSAPSLFWDRPVVLLINTRSYSDAEVFPHAFRALKLGPIVGEQTPGAVIGTTEATLSDGSGFRVTRTGFRNLDGTNQEGNGCMPDHVVVPTIEDIINNRDPQLAKAVELALAAIKPEPKAETPAPAATSGEATPSNQDEVPVGNYSQFEGVAPVGVIPAQTWEHVLWLIS